MRKGREGGKASRASLIHTQEVASSVAWQPEEKQEAQTSPMAPVPLLALLRWTDRAPSSPSRAVFPEKPRVMGLPGMATCLPPHGLEPETGRPPPAAQGSKVPLMWESGLYFYFDPDPCPASLDRLFHISDFSLHSSKMGQ